MADNNENIQYKPPVTIKAGQIQFIEACHPSLAAGEYTARISQQIKESKDAPLPWNSDPYASNLSFWVDAPRFTLDPADIHSVYPPLNQSGRFDNGLPHVVFTRRTLPWERTLNGETPELGKAFPPWVGLLLLEEDELRIINDQGMETERRHEIKSLPIFAAQKDRDSFLVPLNKEEILVPDLGQITGTDKWQKEKARYEKTSCLTIDLPVKLFKAVAPRLDDLPYLAHVRQVDTATKEVLGINDKGWFSLVMGNRLPRADSSHRAFLVSLEGHQDRLQEDWQPAASQMVRLAVLGSWAFTCEGSNDFKAHMHNLSIDSFNLPFNTDYNDDSLSAADVVNGAYACGYTVFNHVMRQGEKTVSWYRGPLVPLIYDKPKQVQEPVSCSDELLRYDPDTGLFDVTYAAAWQLGRLLALQNQSFALALNKTRTAIRARAEWLMRRKELNLPDGKSIEDSLMARIANGLGKELEDAIPK
jgi:hypothetical protein